MPGGRGRGESAQRGVNAECHSPLFKMRGAELPMGCGLEQYIWLMVWAVEGSWSKWKFAIYQILMWKCTSIWSEVLVHSDR